MEIKVIKVEIDCVCPKCEDIMIVEISKRQIHYKCIQCFYGLCLNHIGIIKRGIE